MYSTYIAFPTSIFSPFHKDQKLLDVIYTWDQDYWQVHLHGWIAWIWTFPQGRISWGEWREPEANARNCTTSDIEFGRCSYHIWVSHRRPKLLLKMKKNIQYIIYSLVNLLYHNQGEVNNNLFMPNVKKLKNHLIMWLLKLNRQVFQNSSIIQATSKVFTKTWLKFKFKMSKKFHFL